MHFSLIKVKNIYFYSCISPNMGRIEEGKREKGWLARYKSTFFFVSHCAAIMKSKIDFTQYITACRNYSCLTLNS